MVITKTPELLGAKLPPFYKQRSSKVIFLQGKAFSLSVPTDVLLVMFFTRRRKHRQTEHVVLRDCVGRVMCCGLFAV
jgi:hypothetical protein